MQSGLSAGWERSFSLDPHSGFWTRASCCPRPFCFLSFVCLAMIRFEIFELCYFLCCCIVIGMDMSLEYKALSCCTSPGR